MSKLTIRLAEEKHARLRQLAAAHGVSINRLMDEMATIALVQHDAGVRFVMRSARGSAEKGLAALTKLDRHFKDDLA